MRTTHVRAHSRHQMVNDPQLNHDEMDQPEPVNPYQAQIDKLRKLANEEATRLRKYKRIEEQAERRKENDKRVKEILHNHDQIIAQAAKKRKYFEHRYNALDSQADELEAKPEKLKKAAELRSYKRAGIATEETVKELMEHKPLIVNTYGRLDYNGRGPSKAANYPNGISIWRFHEPDDWSDNKLWVAVYKNKIIGASSLIPPGSKVDAPNEPYSHIGNQIEIKLKTPKTRHTMWGGTTELHNAGYREWSAQLKKVKNPNTLVELNMRTLKAKYPDRRT